MTLTAFTILDVCLAVLSLFLVKGLLGRNRSSGILPPGPKRKPIIGNLLEWPTDTKEWETFGKWSKQYGDLVSAKVISQTMIIINSYATAVEMLEKKSLIYSDRPVLLMAGELGGWNKVTPLLRDKERLRLHRRLVQRAIGTQTYLKRFHPVLETTTHEFLRRILDQPQPEKLAKHVRYTAGAIILKIAYGYDLQDEDDLFVEQAEQAVADFVAAVTPGAFLVDLIPSLQYLPEWFPGAGFKRLARTWDDRLNKAVQDPHDFVKANLGNSSQIPSFSQSLLEGRDVSAEEEFDIKWVSATFYLAGSDTTVSAVYALFLCLALNPDVLAKAQAEIDTVIGTSRLPTLADRSSLPYIDALSKELLRWNAITPTGIVHRLTEDDIQDGYLIPAGSIVFANIEGMLHDPRMYLDPYQFEPSRFLPELSGRPAEQDPRAMSFGFGRRICPGIHLADASVFIACAMVVSMFDVGKMVENGEVIEPVYKKLPGMVSHPAPFRVSIKPRSENSVRIIRGD